MITHKSYRLLIVDDEKNLCRMLQTAFSIDGHETRVAEDGEAALISFVQDK
ncbi:two-component system response regulator, partial [Klebsiella pneumoniae]|nr:two-component system response regulator [Klebsiella pneumoniae]